MLNDSPCDRIHICRIAVRGFNNGYVGGKQPMAWKEFCAEFWSREFQENMDRCTGRLDATEITLKSALNTNLHFTTGLQWDKAKYFGNLVTVVRVNRFGEYDHNVPNIGQYVIRTRGALSFQRVLSRRPPVSNSLSCSRACAVHRIYFFVICTGFFPKTGIGWSFFFLLYHVGYLLTYWKRSFDVDKSATFNRGRYREDIYKNIR